MWTNFCHSVVAVSILIVLCFTILCFTIEFCVSTTSVAKKFFWWYGLVRFVNWVVTEREIKCQIKNLVPDHVHDPPSPIPTPSQYAKFSKVLPGISVRPGCVSPSVAKAVGKSR